MSAEWDVTCGCGFGIKDTGMTDEGRINLFKRVVEHRAAMHEMKVRRQYLKDNIAFVIQAIVDKFVEDTQARDYFLRLFTLDIERVEICHENA